MKPFSERIGVRPSKTIIQKKSMDDGLKTKLWNGLHLFYWNSFLERRFTDSHPPNVQVLFWKIWDEILCLNVDEMPNYTIKIIQLIKDYYYKTKWFEAYDLLEFIPKEFGWGFEGKEINYKFYDYCNDILKKELSAYRFINGFLTPITSEQEVLSIEMAMNINDEFSPVAEHIDTSLRMLSDKKDPDYRNSIKESISAVESYCSIMVREPKATLGKALAKIEVKNDIHPSLKEAFNKLYGYTSDEEGIRHKLLDAPNVKQEDAVFMLVTCSAFINYLKQKEI